jgi:hypothetical protein
MPREFEKDNSDFHIFWWDAIFDNGLDQKQTLATLYNNAIATFGVVRMDKRKMTQRNFHQLRRGDE